MKLLFIIFLLTGMFAAHAQTNEQIDANLSTYLKKITYLGNNNSPVDADSIDAANDVLENYLKKVLKKPSTLKASFSNVEKNGLIFSSSNDGNIRFYSWDTWSGGTTHNFIDLAQFMTSTGIELYEIPHNDGDPGCFYIEINSVHTKMGVVYMPVYETVASSLDKGEGITAYKIENDKLIKVPIFKTTTKTLTEIKYDYNTINQSHWKGPEIHFNEDMSALYIPIVTKSGSFTNKYLTYIFDGSNFVFDKNAK